MYLHAGVIIKGRCIVSFSLPLLMGEEGNRKLDALIDVKRVFKSVLFCIKTHLFLLSSIDSTTTS